MRAATLIFLLGFTSFAGAQTPAKPEQEKGLAAVYTSALNGKITASGQVYDETKLTAAHKSLPYGTKVRVTNVKNNKNVVLRINDRGPTQPGRVLDISLAAAKKLGIPAAVMREVTVEVVELGNGKTTRQPPKP